MPFSSAESAKSFILSQAVLKFSGVLFSTTPGNKFIESHVVIPTNRNIRIKGNAEFLCFFFDFYGTIQITELGKTGVLFKRNHKTTQQFYGDCRKIWR